ncbi:MAG: hypothetical protein LBC18_00295, partial [Opitutaceae bacterium]|nr:hypothetical protein [Opitutaceae bacterium]
MSLLSTLANATGLSAPGSLLPPPAIPCICPLKLLDQLKSLIPTLPIEFPEIPVPDLKGLDPLVAAAPATPATSFIRARLDLVGKIKIPPALARIPLDPMQLGGMQSAPPLVRLVEGMMKTKIDDPKIALKVQGSLAGLTKIPLPPIPDGQLPPPPPAHVQRLSVTVTQMRMARAVLGLKLVPIAPRSLVKLQLAIKAAATIPPLPLEQMAPLAPLAAIVNVAVRMGIDLRAPQAIARLAAKLAAVAQLPPPPPPPPALPQVLN